MREPGQQGERQAMKRNALNAAAATLCAIVSLGAASGTASAAVKGNVGAFSEYVFRGVAAEGGAAVQGGIDYFHDSGFLGGIWASNTALFGGSELDVYAGYLHHFSETVAVDVFALYYVLPEDQENPPFAPATKDLDTAEFGTTLFAGPVKAQFYYSPDFVATGKPSFYYSAAYTYQVTPTVAITGQAGYTHGGGAELAFGDKYVDYSLSIAKTIMPGLVFSLTAVDTNLSAADLPNGRDDDPKVYLGVKYTFDF